MYFSYGNPPFVPVVVVVVVERDLTVGSVVVSQDLGITISIFIVIKAGIMTPLCTVSQCIATRSLILGRATAVMFILRHWRWLRKLTISFCVVFLFLRCHHCVGVEQLGVVHFASGEYEQARERFERVLEMVERLSSQVCVYVGGGSI